MSLVQRVVRERQRVVLPLLGFLIANLAFLGYVIWLQRTVDGAETARASAVVNLETARKKDASAKAQHTSIDRADVELKKFYEEILPIDSRQATSITNFWLSGVARRSQLQIRTGTFEAEPVRDSAMVKVTGEVALTGSYAAIRKFLYEIETSEEFVIVEEVVLNQSTANQSGSIELALKVSTYYLGDGRLVKAR